MSIQKHLNSDFVETGAQWAHTYFLGVIDCLIGVGVGFWGVDFGKAVKEGSAMARVARVEAFAPDEIAVVHVMNRVVRRWVCSHVKPFAFDTRVAAGCS